jgi:hypothetical protein
MSLLPLLVCFKILIDPLLIMFWFLSAFDHIFISLEIISPPFVINDHKRWAQILEKLCETITYEDYFSKFGSI